MGHKLVGKLWEWGYRRKDERLKSGFRSGTVMGNAKFEYVHMGVSDRVRRRERRLEEVKKLRI